MSLNKTKQLSLIQRLWWLKIVIIIITIYYYYYLIKSPTVGLEMAQWLRELDVHPKEMVWFPEPIWQLTTYNSSSRAPNTLFWPPQALYAWGAQTFVQENRSQTHPSHTYTQTLTHSHRHTCTQRHTLGLIIMKNHSTFKMRNLKSSFWYLSFLMYNTHSAHSM